MNCILEKKRVINVDIEDWERKKQYEFFKDFERPQFSVTIEVDVTKLVRELKQCDIKPKINFFQATLYIILKSLNEIENFKYRIENDRVILYEKIGGGFTFMKQKPNYCNCYVPYEENFCNFMDEFRKVTTSKQNEIGIEIGEDVAYLTFAPWGKFTAFTNPYKSLKNDSIPRILWGMPYKMNDKQVISVSIEVHHALMDGYHIGLLIKKLNKNIAQFRTNSLMFCNEK